MLLSALSDELLAHIATLVDYSDVKRLEMSGSAQIRKKLRRGIRELSVFVDTLQVVPLSPYEIPGLRRLIVNAHDTHGWISSRFANLPYLPDEAHKSLHTLDFKHMNGFALLSSRYGQKTLATQLPNLQHLFIMADGGIEATWWQNLPSKLVSLRLVNLSPATICYDYHLVSKLPRTLETLDFSSLNFILPKTEVAKLHTTAIEWDWPDHLTILRIGEVDTLAVCRTVPKSVTRMEMTSKLFDDRSAFLFASWLPRHLKRLKILPMTHKAFRKSEVIFVCDVALPSSLSELYGPLSYYTDGPYLHPKSPLNLVIPEDAILLTGDSSRAEWEKIAKFPNLFLFPFAIRDAPEWRHIFDEEHFAYDVRSADAVMLPDGTSMAVFKEEWLPDRPYCSGCSFWLEKDLLPIITSPFIEKLHSFKYIRELEMPINDDSVALAISSLPLTTLRCDFSCARSPLSSNFWKIMGSKLVDLKAHAASFANIQCLEEFGPQFASIELSICASQGEAFWNHSNGCVPLSPYLHRAFISVQFPSFLPPRDNLPYLSSSFQHLSSLRFLWLQIDSTRSVGDWEQFPAHVPEKEGEQKTGIPPDATSDNAELAPLKSEAYKIFSSIPPSIEVLMMDVPMHLAAKNLKVLPQSLCQLNIGFLGRDYVHNWTLEHYESLPRRLRTLSVHGHHAALNKENFCLLPSAEQVTPLLPNTLMHSRFLPVIPGFRKFKTEAFLEWQKHVALRNEF